MGNLAESSGDSEAARVINKAASSLSGNIYLVMIMALAIAALLIISGIGYIKQSRMKGYVFGNIYGIVGVVWVGLQLATGGVLAIGSILGLIYPIVTLALLNTAFKGSFPNP